MAFEGFIRELDCVDNVEAGLSERTDGARVSRRRVSHDRIDVVVSENVVRSELPDDRGAEPATCHLDVSYREIDSCRHRASAHVDGMLWKVTPAIPLNPADRSAFDLYEVNVNRLGPIDGRAVLSLKAGQIETFIPPGRHVRSGKPFLQQREIRTTKLAE